MRIAAVAHAVPSRTVTNEELVARVMDHPDLAVPAVQRRLFERTLRDLLRRTGAVTRRHRAAGERALDVGIAAGRKALTAAGLSPSDVDLLVYVGVGRGLLEPATGCVFQHALMLDRATSFDVLDACASWLRGFDIARTFLESGRYRRAMILNCECNFRDYIRWDLRSPLDLEDLGVGFTIGEAATATILERSDQDDDGHVSFRTSGAHNDLCRIPLPNAGEFTGDPDGTRHPPLRFYSYGRRLSTRAIDQLDAQFHADERLRTFRPDLVVGHTVSVPVTQTVLARLGLDPALDIDSFPEFGNTVSASLPLGLSLAVERGRLRRGDAVLLIMGSAGLTTGFCRFRY